MKQPQAIAMEISNNHLDELDAFPAKPVVISPSLETVMGMICEFGSAWQSLFDA